MKKLLPILLVLSSTVSLFSQQPAPRILCGNEVFTEIIRSKCPELQQSFDATFEMPANTRALLPTARR